MKKVILLLAVLMISTVFAGCNHGNNGNKSTNPNQSTTPILPEVNPEYSGPANPSQKDMLRIVLLKEGDKEFNATEEIELNLYTGIRAVVKNYKNEIIKVDNKKFKFEVTDKKDSVFTYPNDESGPNPEFPPTNGSFLIIGKRETSGVVLKITHPKAFYTKKQIFNIKKIDHTWDSEYKGEGKSLSPTNQDEGFFSEEVILKFKDNRYDLYEKTFINLTYKGKKLHFPISDGSRRGTFRIEGNKLMLDNKFIFKIEKTGDSIKLIEKPDHPTPFTYEIKHIHGSALF